MKKLIERKKDLYITAQADSLIKKLRCTGLQNQNIRKKISYRLK